VVLGTKKQNLANSFVLPVFRGPKLLLCLAVVMGLGSVQMRQLALQTFQKAFSQLPALDAGLKEHRPEVAKVAVPVWKQTFCQEWQAEAKRLGWSKGWSLPCMDIDWQLFGESVQNRPLVFAVFGDHVQSARQNVTLILSSVHGDEVTPTYLAMRFIDSLLDHGESPLLDHAQVIVAPIVNPDGFYAKPKTRTNAHGVDLNRNFLTKDWPLLAHKVWKTKFASNPRRFPGKQASSEPETRFQEYLIAKFKPHKILSVHSPLNFLDYDGPGAITLEQFPHAYTHRCYELKQALKAKHTGFFTGSLGNYAGKELGIPTVTLELPSGQSQQAYNYWQKFVPGIETLIQFLVPQLPGSQEVQ
jgi:protein MpaA